MGGCWRKTKKMMEEGRLDNKLTTHIGKKRNESGREVEVLDNHQNPEGVKMFMSRGLSLCGLGGGACLASTPEISILGGTKLAGLSTLKLPAVLLPSMVEDFCTPK